MKRLFILIFLFYASIAAAGVYKWVDESGRVHYSDQPQPGAEKIELDGGSTYSPRNLPGTQGTGGNKATKSNVYKRFSITAPADQATFRDKEAKLSARFRAIPSLLPGDAIRLRLNGRTIEERMRGYSKGLGDLGRGSYRLEAEIIDQKGKILIRADSVQFFVHVLSGSDDAEAPTSGDSGESGVDAPQFRSSGSPDYEGESATEGRDASDFATPSSPGYAPGGSSIPHSPGATNPAFTPAY